MCLNVSDIFGDIAAKIDKRMEILKPSRFEFKPNCIIQRIFD